jgi:hypothetical protein
VPLMSLQRTSEDEKRNVRDADLEAGAARKQMRRQTKAIAGRSKAAMHEGED